MHVLGPIVYQTPFVSGGVRTPYASSTLHPTPYTAYRLGALKALETNQGAAYSTTSMAEMKRKRGKDEHRKGKANKVKFLGIPNPTAVGGDRERQNRNIKEAAKG